jgi:hypothetical protein
MAAYKICMERVAGECIYIDLMIHLAKG